MREERLCVLEEHDFGRYSNFSKLAQRGSSGQRGSVEGAGNVGVWER